MMEIQLSSIIVLESCKVGVRLISAEGLSFAQDYMGSICIVHPSLHDGLSAIQIAID